LANLVTLEIFAKRGNESDFSSQVVKLILSAGFSGAGVKRGVYFGRSRSISNEPGCHWART